MLRCLSTEQFEELLAGQMDPVTQELVEGHLNVCGRCRQTFVLLTDVADAPQWRDTIHVSELADEDAAFLNECKKPHVRPVPPGGRVGKAIDASDWLSSDLKNGDRPRLVMHQHGAPAKFPDVPGFEILGELGRGGMGVVYKAKQIAHDRTVALKMILAGSQASAEDLGRFHDEAEAISRLRHPHIVQIFEVGQVEARLFFVLEFVEGGTLADRIHGKPLPPRSAAQLLESLARAMHYAHVRGIVHRDLKPANVLLHGRKAFLDIPEDADRLPNEWDFRRYMPKITDFGLAKMLDRSTGRTASGDVVGTPSYMAPEQAQGKAHPISAATDIYSLGAILYEMLTGKPPFLGPTPMDTLFQVHTQEPIPPRKLVRDVPPGLETICLKCLRKDPTQRYATADDLAEDLRLFVEGQPIQARGTHPLKQGWREFRRKTGTLLFALMVLLIATVAGGAIAYQRWHGEQQTQVVQVGAKAAQRENALLRLRGALDRCEHGSAVAGLVELSDLLGDVDTDPDLVEIRESVRWNLAIWSRQAPILRAVLPGAAAKIALLPDGSAAIVAGRDRSLKRWDVAAGKFAAESATLPEAVEALSVSASGEAAAVLSAGAIRWDSWANLIRGKVAPNADRSLRAAAISPEDGTLLVATGDGKVQLWSRGEMVVKRELFALAATQIVWHPSGKAALLTGNDGTATVAASDGSWGIAHSWKHRSRVTGAAWSREGELAAVACADGFVFLRQASDGQVLAAFPAHGAGPVAVAASRDGRFLLTGGADRLARLWRADSGQLVATLPHPAGIAALAMADRGAFVTLDGLGTVRIWDPPAGAELALASAGNDRLSRPVVGADGQYLYAAAGMPVPTLKRWDLTTGESMQWLTTGESPPARALAIGGHGRAVLVDLPDGRQTIIGAMADRHRRPGPKHDAAVRAALFRPNGPEVLTWDDSGKALVWNGETGKPITAPIGFSHVPMAFAVSGDGQALVIAGEGKDSPGVARVRRLDDKAEPLSPPLQHPEAVVDASFESNGAVLRTRDRLHVVRRWEIATGQLIAPMASDGRMVALSPTGDRFLTLVTDSQLRLHLGPNSTIALLPAAADWRCAEFSPDGRLLLTGGVDGIRLWHAFTGLPLGPIWPLANLTGASFDPSGRDIIAWSATELRVWRLPVEAVESADWRTRTGLARQADGALRMMEAKEWPAPADGSP